MAKSPRQKEFDREFREHLEPFTKPLVSAMKKIIKAKRPAAIKVLNFEVHSDWRDFPVHLFAMDDEAPNEVYYKSPFSGQVLPDAGVFIAPDALDQDGYEDAQVDTFASGAKLIATWFGECWHAAGGAEYPIPVVINHHGRTRFYDLRALKWVGESAIW